MWPPFSFDVLQIFSCDCSQARMIDFYTVLQKHNHLTKLHGLHKKEMFYPNPTSFSLGLSHLPLRQKFICPGYLGSNFLSNSDRHAVGDNIASAFSLLQWNASCHHVWTFATIPKRHGSNHLLVHPWFTTTNISYRFLFLKLPPPPCAVLLVKNVENMLLKSTRNFSGLGYIPVDSHSTSTATDPRCHANAGRTKDQPSEAKAGQEWGILGSWNSMAPKYSIGGQAMVRIMHSNEDFGLYCLLLMSCPL